MYDRCLFSHLEIGIEAPAANRHCPSSVTEGFHAQDRTRMLLLHFRSYSQSKDGQNDQIESIRNPESLSVSVHKELGVL